MQVSDFDKEEEWVNYKKKNVFPTFFSFFLKPAQ